MNRVVYIARHSTMGETRSLGECWVAARQAAIKLAEDADVALTLGIAEGIETALSIQQSCWGPVWALGSAGAIDRFPVLPGVEHLTVWADHDPVGLRAAETCALRWVGAGAEATVRYPLATDTDFNDQTMA